MSLQNIGVNLKDICNQLVVRNNMENVKVLSREEMKEFYGDFYKKSSDASFNAEDVPCDLQGLIPYAEFWAVLEDGDRLDLFDAAPNEVQSNLYYVVQRSNDALNKWLGGKDSYAKPLSAAYIAFTQLTLVASIYQV